MLLAGYLMRFRTVRTDLIHSGILNLRRMSIPRCMAVSVTKSVLSLGHILFVLLIGALFCVLLIVLNTFAIVLGVLMDNYLLLQGALSPCDLAMDSADTGIFEAWSTYVFTQFRKPCCKWSSSSSMSSQCTR